MRLHPGLTVGLFLLTVSMSFAQSETITDVETAKINYLLRSIDMLEGAQFIRNGVAYKATEASAHLRMKWRSAGSHVVTAEDFIRLCASKSSTSGIAYTIRMSDGHTLTAADFLRKQLATYDGH